MKKILFCIAVVFISGSALFAQPGYEQDGRVKCTKCNFPLEPFGCNFGSCLKQKLNEASRDELADIFSPDIAGSIIKFRSENSNASLEAFRQFFGPESFDELARSFELYGDSRKDIYARREAPAKSSTHAAAISDFADPLFFDENRSAIDGANAATLDQLCSQLKDNKETYVVIHGYANECGVSSRNRELSLKRAQAVKEYLVRRGADGGRLLTIAHGEDNPIAPNSTAEGRSKNRRVSLNIRQR